MNQLIKGREPPSFSISESREKILQRLCGTRIVIYTENKTSRFSMSSSCVTSSCSLYAKRSSPLPYAKAPFRRLGSVLRGTERPCELHLWQLHCKTLPSAPGATVRDLRPFRAALRAYSGIRSRPAVGCYARCACSTTASSPC